MQMFHTFNADNICSGTFNTCTHTVKKIGNINYMRLSCCILNYRTS